MAENGFEMINIYISQDELKRVQVFDDILISIIKEYWGGMLSIGATTFWEDFDIRWLHNALPLDAWKRQDGAKEEKR